MAETAHDFGLAARLDADAIGEPGHRRFRLMVAGRNGTAYLWLEKEELQALAVAADQLLARIKGASEWKLYGTPPAPYQPSQGFPPTSSFEFKVGQLSIGYESEQGLFILLVHESGEDPEGPPTFSCMATGGQMRSLSRRIESVVSAGRPRCPLCGEPMDGDGHNCIRSN